jgi:plasmid stabilization system protein ParE
MKPVRLASAANQEIDEAAGWYESQQSGLSDKFLEAIDDAIALIQRHPAAFPVLQDASPPLKIRRALLDRFPYALVFLELATEIRVVAVAHLKRRPGYWLRRIEGSQK